LATRSFLTRKASFTIEKSIDYSKKIDIKIIRQQESYRKQTLDLTTLIASIAESISITIMSTTGRASIWEDINRGEHQ